MGAKSIVQIVHTPAMLEKLFARQSKSAVAGIVALAVAGLGILGVGTAGVMHDIARNRDKSMQSQDGQQTETTYNAKDISVATAQQDTKPDQPQATNQPTQPAAPTPAPAKYSTSSDPRSTAYSSTPPAPNPASFSIKITHNGQLKVGDMVYYNATKGEKAYYNGDLMVSPSTITFSKGGLSWTPIKISSPTSKHISIPTTPWDDHSPYFGVASLNSSPPSPALSYDMIVDMYVAPPAGTYQLHITAGCGDPAGDGCMSDAFITVVVTD